MPAGRTRKASRAETQTHGFEVDLVRANAQQLVLASVKSFLGSWAVVAGHVTGAGSYEQARSAPRPSHNPQCAKPHAPAPRRRPREGCIHT